MPSQPYGLGTSGQGETFEHKLPSGNVCLMRPLDIQALLLTGLLDSLDELTEMVQDLHLNRVAGKRPKAAETDDQQALAAVKLLRDKAGLEKLVRMAETVMLATVVEPVVYPVPAPNPDGQVERHSDLLYVDTVDFADKMSVFQAATESIRAAVGAVAPFREGPAATVHPLGSVQDLPRKAKRARGGA